MILILIISVILAGCTNEQTGSGTQKSIQPENNPNEPGGGPDNSNHGYNRPPGGFMKEVVKNLTEKGYDMSQVQAAVDKGDNLTALQLLNQFWDQHPEARPTLNIDPNQIPARIERMKQQGINVSDIEQVYNSGDINKTLDLLRKASPMGPPGQRPGP